MSEKMKPIELGDTMAIGEKEFELDPRGVLVMQCAIPERQEYGIAALQSRKAQLTLELVEINSLIAKYQELLTAKAAEPV